MGVGLATSALARRRVKRATAMVLRPRLTARSAAILETPVTLAISFAVRGSVSPASGSGISDASGPISTEAAVAPRLVRSASEIDAAAEA